MKNVLGYAVNLVSCLYIVVTIVVYCFPYSMPVEVNNMNYSSAITGGLTVCITAWFAYKRKYYVRPAVVIIDGVLVTQEPVSAATVSDENETEG